MIVPNGRGLQPTNHPFPALVEELEAALANYDGTLAIVSHNRPAGAALRRMEDGGHYPSAEELRTVARFDGQSLSHTLGGNLSS
ncbi:hypothetical protein [Nonomuraea sp. NPDC046570]|uniref:hypothetical protein n=1 Tax=Nonomuraea sp. NPDC046570 TaxID=3155255 RepID=UPI0033F46ADB